MWEVLLSICDVFCFSFSICSYDVADFMNLYDCLYGCTCTVIKKTDLHYCFLSKLMLDKFMDLLVDIFCETLRLAHGFHVESDVIKL